jgi:hypothetical protein
MAEDALDVECNGWLRPEPCIELNCKGAQKEHLYGDSECSYAVPITARLLESEFQVVPNSEGQEEGWFFAMLEEQDRGTLIELSLRVPLNAEWYDEWSGPRRNTPWTEAD